MDSLEWEILIPAEPVAKGRPRADRRHGRMYTPKATRLAEKELRCHLEGAWKGSPISKEVPLSVSVTFYIKRPKSVSVKKRPHPTTKPDVDNYLKLVLDSLNGIVIEDDSAIVDVHARKRYSTVPSVHLHLKVLSTAPQD